MNSEVHLKISINLKIFMSADCWRPLLTLRTLVTSATRTRDGSQPHKQDNKSRFPLLVSSSFFPTHLLSYLCSSVVIDFASKAIVVEIFLGHFGHQDCLLCSPYKPTDLCVVEVTFCVVFCFSQVRMTLVYIGLLTNTI